MERTTIVHSSNIHSVGYDAETRRLEVEFASGARYMHQNVPPELHKAFIEAQSAGKFYQEHLRSRFDCAKVMT